MSDITIDEQFIEYVVKALVGKPDAVSIERTIDEKGVLLLLTVDPEDLGRVIGKRGATAQSMRTLLRALGTKNEARYNLKIVDNGYPKPDRDERREDEPVESKKDETKEDTTEQQPKAKPIETKVDEPVEEEATAPEKPAEDSDDSESAIERTRRELEDLDDLDI